MLPDAGVERGGLHFEFLHDVRRRDVRRDDLAGVRGGGARHAVDRQVAAVAARAVHRVADDVRRLEGPIEPRRSGVGDAGGQADKRIGIAVGRRQLRDAPRVDHVPEGGVGRLEQRRIGRDGHRLDRLADGEREVDLEPVGDADLDFTHRFLEALQLGVHLIHTRDQIGDLVEADLVGDDADVGPHLFVRDRDRRAGDHASARVANRAGDRAARLLRRRRCGQREGSRRGDDGGDERGQCKWGGCRSARAGVRSSGEALKMPPDGAAALSRQPCHSLPPLIASLSRDGDPSKNCASSVQRLPRGESLIRPDYMIYDCGNTRPIQLVKWSNHSTAAALPIYFVWQNTRPFYDGRHRRGGRG